MIREYVSKKNGQPIHLFNKIWKIGKLNRMKKTKRSHCVIHSPENKEYHVYDEDALDLCLNSWNRSDIQIRTERINPAKVKIYIQTHILDSPENWSSVFDDVPIRSTNKISVIFDNGTIMTTNAQEAGWTRRIPQNCFSDYGEKLKCEEQGFKNIVPVYWKLL